KFRANMKIVISIVQLSSLIRKLVLVFIGLLTMQLHAGILSYDLPAPGRSYAFAAAESGPEGGKKSDSEKPEGGEKDGDSVEALAKAAQNPVADLISVPFQNNFNFGIGPNDVTQYILNFQPVVPVSLNENWNLITRTIVPIINQPSPASGVRSAFGLGDINP